MNEYLAVARSTCAHLISESGEPVWPIERHADEGALRKIARLFGCTIRVTEAAPGAVVPNDETVLALGGRLAGSAQLYAHLTRRHWQVIDTIAELREVTNAHVLLCTWNQLTFDLLAHIHAYGSRSHPIGLVVADSATSMRRQVLIHSAAACLCGATIDSVVLVTDSFDIEELSAPGLSMFGRNVQPSVLADALVGNAGFVGMKIHGDGLDSGIIVDQTVRAVICAVKGESNWELSNQPDCVAARYCHRLQLDLVTALCDERVIDSRELSCRVAIILSCFGIPVRRSLVAPQWSMLRSRLDAGHVGALVTPWGLMIPSDDLLCFFATELMLGRTIGEALAGSYSYLGDKSEITRLCLFGDPRVRLRSNPDSLAALEALQEQFRATSSAGNVESQASVFDSPGLGPMSGRARAEESLGARARLLAACIELLAADVATSAICMRLVNEARAAIACLTSRTSDTWSAEEVLRASTSALRALAKGKPLWRYLSRLSSEAKPVMCAMFCHSCGLPLRATRRALRIPGATARLELWCDRCAVVANTEFGSAFANGGFSFVGGKLVLSPDLCVQEIYATLGLKAWWHGQAVWELFPTSEREVQIAEVVPGATIASVQAMSNLELFGLYGVYCFSRFPNSYSTL